MLLIGIGQASLIFEQPLISVINRYHCSLSLDKQDLYPDDIQAVISGNPD